MKGNIENDRLSRLARRLADQGPQPFHTELVHLASRARCCTPGAAAALADPASPDVVRLRAFSVVARSVVGADCSGTDRVA